MENRIIKFRAWHKYDNWDLGYKDESNPFSFEMVTPEFLSNNHVNSDDYYFMFFTGLVDKNNTEIFEGDLIRHFLFRDSGTVPIIFKNGSYIPDFDTNENFNDDWCCIVNGKMPLIEVVGNIFENQGLVNKAV